MPMIHTVVRLGRDPEQKYTPSGKAVTNCSGARDETRGSGENKTKVTTWFRLTLWEKDAENFNNYAHKGDVIEVEGDLVVDPATGSPTVFTGQDGVAKTSLEINVRQWRNWSPKAQAA